MTIQEKAVNAVRAQIEILIVINIFEKLGFIVEPDSTKHLQIPHLQPMTSYNNSYSDITIPN